MSRKGLVFINNLWTHSNFERPGDITYATEEYEMCEKALIR